MKLCDLNYTFVGDCAFVLEAMRLIRSIEKIYDLNRLPWALCVLAELCSAVFTYNKESNTVTLTYIGI